MYPHTRIEIIDQSYIPKLSTNETYMPLLMYVFSSDKGQEELRVINKDFVRDYGELSFTRHGQVQLQADRTIKNGGQILVKRVVAPDSTLANIVVVAKTKEEEEQKLDSNGQPVYIKDGVETSDPLDADPVMIKKIRVKYETMSIENATSADTINLAVNVIPEVDSDGFKTYPLFSIYDNGRGVSTKKFRVTPDYEGSKTIDFLRYRIDTIENNAVTESVLFSFDPELIYLNMAFSLEAVIKDKSSQIKSKMYANNFTKFNDEVSAVTGIPNMLTEDFLFGKKRTTETIPSFILDNDSVNLSNVYGIALASGSNGAFGNNPLEAKEYEDALLEVFNGTYSDDIYDHIKYPVEVILDANYPEAVKRAIEDLCIFREDITFIGDMGTSLTTMNQFKDIVQQSTLSPFCAYSHLWYDVIEPSTKKQITVTYTYSMAKVMPKHLIYGRNRPLAGLINEAILDDAIEGTVNFTPKVTPKLNQKQEMDDMRVNYASWIGNRLVLETQYTTQPKYTQLSFINNVLAIQEVIRAVRNRCPATRYSFIDGEDLEIYQKDVQSVLNRYTDNFAELTFEYIEDNIMVQNKIFHAAIVVKFRNYVQAEYFKIYAIGEEGRTN